MSINGERMVSWRRSILMGSGNFRTIGTKTLKSRLRVKVEVKLSLCFHWVPRHEGVWGSGVIAPRILWPRRWRWVVSFTPQPLYSQGKIPWYPLDRRLGELQRRSERGGEEKNSQHLPGLEPPIIQPIAQRCSTELSWLC
jgi:hypothetical protein